MKVRKPQSKRVPVRLRNKIEKRSAAKQRKDRKQAKKDPTWRSKLKKDPGIPNLFPYKDRILAEIEEKKQLKQEETERRREEAKAARKAQKLALAETGAMDEDDEDEEEGKSEDELEDEEVMDEDGGGDSSNPMAALLASARARAVQHDNGEIPDEGTDSEDDDEEPMHNEPRADSSAKAFKHLFPEVLSTSDIILYVLDARDPPSTRSIPTERQIAAHEGGKKRMVLILNKIDLVPAQVLARWLTYLRRFHLTLPIRASPPAANAKTYEHKGLTAKSTAETLLKALKAYAAKQDLKRAMTVGVVGYPNVGKSSVINVLVSQLGRKKAPAPTGAEAGVTTALRTVKLDNKLTLLDSPGVIFPAATQSGSAVTDASTKPASNASNSKDAHARLVLLNAVPPKFIEDPVPAVQLLLQRISILPDGLSGIESYYSIPPLVTVEDDLCTDFLVQVARKRGRLGKGGVPNLNAAAMTVLGDWRDGRIGAWVEPPRIEVVGVTKDQTGDVSMEGANQAGEGAGDEDEKDRKEIVTEWAKEFELEGLWGSSAGAQDEQAAS